MLSLDELTRHLIVPVVVLNDAGRAEGLAAALVAGGLPVAEVTLRTPDALTALATMAANPDLLVGAGTVIEASQVDQVADAGARFIVSPGLSREVVDRARARDLFVLPGVVTPTEIIAARDLGFRAVKFFPAGNYGGASTLKALSQPFVDMQFVPTGGVSTENLADYLALPSVPAVGGSWMVSAKLVDAGDFEAVADLTRSAVAAAAEAKQAVR